MRIRAPEIPLFFQLENRQLIFEHVVDRADAWPFDAVRQRLRDQMTVADVRRFARYGQPEIELALDRRVDREIGRFRKNSEIGAVAALQDGVAADVAPARFLAHGLREAKIALEASRRRRAERDGRHGIGRDRALHIRRAAAPELAVAHLAGKRPRALPLLGLLGRDRNDIGVRRPDQRTPPPAPLRTPTRLGRFGAISQKSISSNAPLAANWSRSHALGRARSAPRLASRSGLTDGCRISSDANCDDLIGIAGRSTSALVRERRRAWRSRDVLLPFWLWRDYSGAESCGTPPEHIARMRESHIFRGLLEIP